jgi:YidC/Oxa1 family membrane protein insertase
MLELMKFFYRVIPNYGVAILLLTLLVRLIMFPLQHKSMKSMKKMQELQPYLKGLQEKYKNDKEKLNKEMMQFMKTHKVNPMGGCLPMLLQLPVFIALYKVLGNAVELYKSPFIFWISDLSSKDPYYVLPILMGIMMFLQQKMTPNPTMDPTQAKMMLFFLPVIFTIFMLSLPSGLTLYIMFSTLLGIVQQYMMNKNKGKVTT